MEKYRVEITETLTRTVEVFASDDEEAEKKVINMYQNEEVVLDFNDLDDTSFETEKCYEDLTNVQIDTIVKKVKSLPKSDKSERVEFTEDGEVYNIFVNAKRTLVSSVTVSGNGIDKNVKWDSLYKINTFLK